MSACFRWLSVSAVLFGLACSGGGGGGSGSASVGLNSAAGIASGVVQGVFLARDVGEFTDAGLTDPGVAPARYEAPIRPGEAPGAVTRAPFGPTPKNCDDDGSVTLSGDVDDPDMLAVGDQVIADFLLCDDGIGLVFDGIFDFTITALDGDIFDDAFAATFDVLMTALSVIEDGDTYTFDGDGVLDLDLDTTTPGVEMYGLDGGRLAVTEAGVSSTLTGYTSDLELDFNEVPEDYTFSAGGRLNSSAFAGGVDYATTIPFMGSGDDYPDSGELLITGDFNATIRVMVNDSTTVDLELDQNGDGNPDGLISNVSWDELFGIVP